jgi:hypothetical protein
MNEGAAIPLPDDLRWSLARALFALDRTEPVSGEAFDRQAQDLRDRYLAWADALADGPLAAVRTALQACSASDEELRVLRRQRMAPERERELLEANSRMHARTIAAEASLAAAEAALAAARREAEVAREAETFWQQFAFDADDLATRRLIEQTSARAEAERSAIRERCRRERAENALRLFADRADVMPKEGWASELAQANRDIPLWWFHAARVALAAPAPGEAQSPVSDAAGPISVGP